MTANDVLAGYERRFGALEQGLAQSQRVHGVAATGLAVAAICFLVLGVYALKKQISFWWPLVCVPAAIGAVRTYARSRRSGYRMWRLKRFYSRGIARLQGDWPGNGDAGEEFDEPNHLYARDLNLFGEGSLFELLSIARSSVGKRGLAGYLLNGAPLEEVLARQQAVRELSGQTDLREEVALLGPSENAESRWETFSSWLNAPPSLLPRWFRIVIAITSVALACVIATGLLGVIPWVTTARWMAPFVVFHAAAGLAVRARINRMIVSLRVLATEIGMIRQGLELIEKRRFESPKLAALREQVRGASTSVRRLELLLDALNERHKEWFYLPSLVLMLGTQLSSAVEAWRIRNRAAMQRWLAAWAEFEALNTLACYCHENPDHTFPEFVEGPACFEARGIGHPLLPNGDCVRNDVELNGRPRFYIISGSNMSGKSTLLRTIGLNAVLALAGAPVRAEALRLSPLSVCASISVADSLLNGKSGFMAEVDRLREAIELTGNGKPVLFLIDEIFGGTNSRDRRVAAEAVVRTLVERGAIGALSTHDLALSEIADDDALGGANVHMGSRNGTDPMDFDYRLKPGVTREANALAIARMAGVRV